MSRDLSLGAVLTDAQLAAFHGGVTEGGCIPNPVAEALEKLTKLNTTVEQ